MAALCHWICLLLYSSSRFRPHQPQEVWDHLVHSWLHWRQVRICGWSLLLPHIWYYGPLHRQLCRQLLSQDSPWSCCHTLVLHNTWNRFVHRFRADLHLQSIPRRVRVIQSFMLLQSYYRLLPSRDQDNSKCMFCRLYFRGCCFK